MSSPASETESDIDALYEALGDAQPRNCTRPHAGYRSELNEMDATARMVGVGLYPWQRLAARIMSERDPQHPDRYRYPTVIISCMRQIGKSTMMGVERIERGIFRPRRWIRMTAQTGKDARARWHETVELAKPLGPSIKIRLQTGGETMTFPGGAKIQCHPPKADAGHGDSPQERQLDECWDFTMEQGDALTQAGGPSQITHKDRQTIMFSTVGDPQSTWWRSQYDAGVASLNDPDSRIAFVDFGIAEELDAMDENNWLCNPGLGHSITMDDLREQVNGDFANNPDGFARAFLNRWAKTAATQIIAESQLQATIAESMPDHMPAGDVCIGADIALDRSRSAIVAAWQPQTGPPVIKLLKSDAGWLWLWPTLLKMSRTLDLPQSSIVVDDAGAMRSVLDTQQTTAGYQLDDGSAGRSRRQDFADHCRITVTAGREFADACNDLIGRWLDGRLRHDGSQPLMAAARLAATRRVGLTDSLDRRASSGPIPEMTAAALALRAATHRIEHRKPKIYTI